MRRRRVPDAGQPELEFRPPPAPPSDREIAASASVRAFARKPKVRKTRDRIEEARLEMERRAKSGDWEGATGLHLVLLYAWLHEEVYGVRTSELTPKWRGVAAQMADRLIAGEFAGDVGAAVDFMKWSWKREEGREKWRRENQKEGGRLGWRLQFGGVLVTDYRVDQARRSG